MSQLNPRPNNNRMQLTPLLAGLVGLFYLYTRSLLTLNADLCPS